MSSNFWSRSRSLKGLNNLVDDAFLKIDENNKKEDSNEESTEEKEDLEIEKEEEKEEDEKEQEQEDDNEEEEQEEAEIEDEKSFNEEDNAEEKELKAKKISPFYDPYFFADPYMKDSDYREIIKTANISGNKYRPNLAILDKLLKMEDLTRILVLQLVGDHEDFLSLEDYFANPIVLCKLLDYILDPRYCVEEEEDTVADETAKTDEAVVSGKETDMKPEIEIEVEPETEVQAEKEAEVSKINSASSTEDMDLIEFYKCAVGAVDVLVIDINAIVESFLKHDFLIKKLWSMLDRYPRLANDASAAFLKINERLLQFAELSSISEENSMVSQWMDSMDHEEEDTFMDVFMSYPKGSENGNEEETRNTESSPPSEEKPITDAKKQSPIAEVAPECELMNKMSTLERYLYFIVIKENMVDKFIKHLEISSFMDFLLKIISTDKPKQPTYVILLLKQQQLIEKLLDCLDSSNVSSVQNTATDFLKALITLSANSNNEIASAIGPNELTRRLVSPGMISKIGLLMAQGGLPLSNCVGIIIEIIRKNHSDYDLVQVMQTSVESHPPDIRDPIYLGNMIQYFARNLPELCVMMKKSLSRNFKTPFGIIEPLGMDRFKVCELIAELLHCSNMALLNEFEGEQIVKERDPLRRELITTLLKDHFLIESNDFDEDDEAQFDMRDTLNCLSSTASTEAAQRNTEAKEETNENDNGSDENISVQLESLNIKSEDNSSDDVSDQVKPHLQNSDIVEKIVLESEKGEFSGKPHSGEVFGDLDYLQTEEEIRKTPVIGDMLKLSMKDNNVVDTVLEMLFDFPWNNFLHNVVFDIVQQILNGSLQDGINRFLIADLFLESRITELIIAGDQYCQQYEETNKLRLGYMGHLTLIAEEVAKFVSYLEEMNIHMLMPEIEEMLSEKAWVDYSNVVLNEARERYNSTFGDEDAGLIGDGWGGSEFDSDGIIEFRDGDVAKGNDQNDDSNNRADSDYPDVSFRNSVDEMMLGRHSDDIQIDIEAENEDDEGSCERSDDEDDSDNINRNTGLFGSGSSEEQKQATSSLEDEEDDVNEDSTIEYVNLSGEVVVTTVKEFLKMNSVASMNNPYPDNEFKEIKTISNSKSSSDSEDALDTIDTKETGLSNKSELLDDEDDYIDPNDDGHSYAKVNSLLYGRDTKLVRALDDSSDSDEINSSNSDSSSDEDVEEEEEGFVVKDNLSPHKSKSDIAFEDGRGLCRQMTKDNMKWDESEQQRIFGYKKLHDESL